MNAIEVGLGQGAGSRENDHFARVYAMQEGFELGRNLVLTDDRAAIDLDRVDNQPVTRKYSRKNDHDHSHPALALPSR